MHARQGEVLAEQRPAHKHSLRIPSMKRGESGPPVSLVRRTRVANHAEPDQRRAIDANWSGDCPGWRCAM